MSGTNGSAGADKAGEEAAGAARPFRATPPGPAAAPCRPAREGRGLPRRRPPPPAAGLPRGFPGSFSRSHRPAPAVPGFFPASRPAAGEVCSRGCGDPHLPSTKQKNRRGSRAIAAAAALYPAQPALPLPVPAGYRRPTGRSGTAEQDPPRIRGVEGGGSAPAALLRARGGPRPAHRPGPRPRLPPPPAGPRAAAFSAEQRLASADGGTTEGR